MKDRNPRLELEQTLAQWLCLRNQLSPHFLFNSLSILSSLVRHDTALSEMFIDHLSRTYRYILEPRGSAMVLLRSEIEFIRSFCFLLKIRFSDKFDLQLDVPESVWDEYLLIPLTLQPLVENAIRFNRMSQKDPLIVRICFEPEGLLVSNRIRLRSVPGGHEGEGLENLRQRYQLWARQAVEVTVSEERFTVRIPLRRSGSQDSIRML